MEPNPTSETLLQHVGFVRGLAHALLRDAHAADDVAQEAALQWLRRARDVANPRAWLRRAVRNLASNQRRSALRRAAHEERAAPHEPPRSPADESERAELLHRLVDAVFELEGPYRETILARYFRGLSARELARERGEPLATVRSRERRALELLRAKLDRHDRERGAWAVALARLLPRRTLAVAAMGTAAVLVALTALSVTLFVAKSSSAGTIVAVDPLPHSPLGSPRESQLAPEAQRAAATLESAPPAEGESESELLHGIATDEEGRPLEGVHVTFTRAGDALAPEAHSGVDGRFTVEGLSHFTGLGAELAGYRLLHANDPENDVGPWDELRIVLSHVGRLAITAFDTHGHPMSDVDVGIHVAPEDCCELDGTGQAWNRRSEHLDGTTDENGRAVFDGVWSGVKLVCTLEPVNAVYSSYARPVAIRQAAGRLVFEPEISGSPIVVRRGGDLELQARWEREVHLKGSVVWPDGSLSGEITVEVCDRGRAGDEVEQTVASYRSDDGRFDFTLCEPYLLGSLLVRAWKKRLTTSTDVLRADGRVAFTFVSASGSYGSCEVGRESSEEEGELRVELRETNSTWAGLDVVDADGSPLSTGVALRVLSAGPLRPDLRRATVTSPGAPSIFTGLMDDPTDLAVWFGPSITNTSTSVHVYRNVATQSVAELRRPRTSEVRVRLKMTAGVAKAMTLTEVRFPSARRSSTFPTPMACLDKPWPSELATDAGNGSTRRSEDGLTVRYVDRACFRDGEIVIEPGDAGWYRFGLQAWDAHGRAFAPRTSDLGWYATGEHALTCELVPTATLAGRIVADGTREFLGLALVDERGAPIPLAPNPDAGFAEVVPVATHGRFRLDGVPLGRCRLRAGSVDELAAGRFRREVALDVGAETNTALEIRL